jgi:hypothetical protein
MKPLNSRAVSESPESYAGDLTFWDDVYYAILGTENELAS